MAEGKRFTSEDTGSTEEEKRGTGRVGREEKVVRKAKALGRGAKISVFAPASPADPEEILTGIAELRRLGFEFTPTPSAKAEGYFASPKETRLQGFLHGLRDAGSRALVATRGGYGTTYLLDEDLTAFLAEPKCVVGYSDLTVLQVYLWEKAGWVTFQGPMVAAGFNHGADDAHGYDENSFLQAVGNAAGGWTVGLRGETLTAGEAEGRLLGGCLTMVQTTIGTPWELDTEGAILLLEDTGVRPYQVDRALVHLQQAGKLRGVKGVVLGEFPGGEAAAEGSPTVRDVCARVLGRLGVPVVFGAAVGHTKRAMLTLPMGVRVRLKAGGEGEIEVLEGAVE